MYSKSDKFDEYLPLSQPWRALVAGDQCDQVGRFILGKFLNPLASINLPKYPTFLGNFCKGVKIYHFSSEIIFG